MLGRRKRLLEEISFLTDVLGGILVMIAVYFFLHFFGREWQQFLRATTGYPFNRFGFNSPKLASFLIHKV